MKTIFVSNFFNLDNQLEELGVFNSIMTKDSHFFINIIRLRDSQTPEFSKAYNHFNGFFENIVKLLDASTTKGDKLYNTALKYFNFSGLNCINLGFSESGKDVGFGKVLSSKVISDAFDIIKAGSKQPEIFQLTSLFEDNVGPDRLSDMIATIIRPEIEEYTRRINRILKLDKDHYPHIEFENEIAINPYKKCQLLYLPTEVLHELPIARSWDDIDRVITENEKIRAEINDVVALNWKKMLSSEKKKYIKEQILMIPDKCERIIEGFKNEKIDTYDIKSNLDYLVDSTFSHILKDGAFNSIANNKIKELDSYEVALGCLNIIKKWFENNKGWEIPQSVTTNKREKVVQRLIHLGGQYFCEINNIDMSFEVNNGNGPVDLKLSRGNDKTIIEVKLSSNKDYLNGYLKQIEEYAKAENTNKRIYLYIKVGNPKRDILICDLYEKSKEERKNPPLLYIIDSTPQLSASKK